MRYILKEQFLLRGWKNKPFNILCESQPIPPQAISQQEAELLGHSFEYTAGDPLQDSLLQMGWIRPCTDQEELTEKQQYFNYGCLHFDSVIFSITGRCNYKCMHCSVNAPLSKSPEFSLDQIKNQLDQMQECGLNRVVLIGGEPLIRKDFLDIVDAVLDRNMFISEIFTNGSLVTEQLLDALEARHIQTMFQISFDGVGYHDIMRGVKGAEQDFYRCVSLLRKRHFPVICNMCITRDSIRTIWDTIVALEKLEVSSLTIYPPVECGLWKEKYDTLGATVDMIGSEYPAVIEKYMASNFKMDLNLYGLMYFIGYPKKYVMIPKWRCHSGNYAANPACTTFLQELNISPEGILSPCYALMEDDYIRTHMPDITKMPLKEALTKSLFTDIMELKSSDISAHNSKCAACEYFSLCGGGCRMSAFEKNGDFRSYDPQMCIFFENGMYDAFREAAKKGSSKRMSPFAALLKNFIS